jgi:hypothetical protein
LLLSPKFYDRVSPSSLFFPLCHVPRFPYSDILAADSATNLLPLVEREERKRGFTHLAGCPK